MLVNKDFQTWHLIGWQHSRQPIRSHVRTSLLTSIEWNMDFHYNDVIMSAIASQITSLTIVYSTVYSDADQRKHQSSASLAFVRGIHRRPVNSPHKGPVTRKMFPLDDVTMYLEIQDPGETTNSHYIAIHGCNSVALAPNIIITVSVRSGVFRHNQDSSGTHGLYRHNKTSLLASTGDDTSIKDKVDIIKRLVKSFDEIKCDLMLAIRWRWLCFKFICYKIIQQSCEWREICDTTSHRWCPHEKCSVNSWLVT